MRVNIANAKVKRRYFERLREAEGLAGATVNAHEKAISRFDDYTRQEDYRKFNRSRAVGFKKWLERRNLSTATVYHTLRYFKTFMVWLSGQAGYKSKVMLDDVSYLALDKKSVTQVTAAKPVRVPTLEYIRHLADSIEPKSDIDRRDRALIAFLLVSGMRDQAVATLPLGCFDQKELVVHQDPNEGVQTKFNKTIVTRLMQFDAQLVSYVSDWAEFLSKDRLFGSTDPLFPRSKVEQADGLCFSVTGIEPVFWRSTGPIREIAKKRSAGAGLEYYHPHSFRHAAVHIAMKHCKTAEELRAISQNLGHEHVATTLTSYGRLELQDVDEVIKGMDFRSGSACKDDSLSDEITEAIRMIIAKRRPNKD